jgi:uncharacterized membrane protein
MGAPPVNKFGSKGKLFNLTKQDLRWTLLSGYIISLYLVHLVSNKEDFSQSKCLPKQVFTGKKNKNDRLKEKDFII